MLPKILVFAGSVRSGSHNARLAARAVKELLQSGAEVTRVSLADYPLPLYDADIEAGSGPPENAVKLKHLMTSHEGIFIVTPEYNASVPPLLKNALDWISRVQEPREPPLAAFRNRAFALGAASERPTGGLFALLALRQLLEIGCGALVLPEQIAVAQADEAFDGMDDLIREHDRDQLQNVVNHLIARARGLA